MRLQKYIKEETYPLPDIGYNEIGLMTKSEFLEYQNEEGKRHSSDSYDFDKKSMNRDNEIVEIGRSKAKGNFTIYKTSKKDGYIIEKDSKRVAIYIKGVLYHTIYVERSDIPTVFYSFRDETPLEIKKYERVKYLSDKLKILSDIVAKNYKSYPVLINRFKNFEGDYYELRAEKKLVKDKGISLAIFNSDGEVVAIAQDEWGATLMVVAREYRGKGLGKIILKKWTETNPGYRSGGFTAEGEKTSIGVWEDRVREFLEYGWYSKLIKMKKITKEKVNSILYSLSKKKVYKSVEQKKSKQEPLFLIEDDLFVIYDKSFYDINDYYAYDGVIEKTIYAKGLLRSNRNVGTYVYSIDYEPKYRQISTEIILQMAKDAGDKLYYGKGYTDVLELKGINIERDGDYISLVKDILPIKKMSSMEKKYRKQRDKYNELYSIILETAESKWK